MDSQQALFSSFRNSQYWHEVKGLLGTIADEISAQCLATDPEHEKLVLALHREALGARKVFQRVVSIVERQADAADAGDEEVKDRRAWVEMQIKGA